jgi:hypothetical protein
MITTTTALCISEGAVVIVIIWRCDLQLHMSCITEIQEAVMVVIIWWCDLPYDHDHDGLLYFSNTLCHILLKYKGPLWS